MRIYPQPLSPDGEMQKVPIVRVFRGGIIITDFSATRFNQK